jgi:hypothetical protein
MKRGQHLRPPPPPPSPPPTPTPSTPTHSFIRSPTHYHHCHYTRSSPPPPRPSHVLTHHHHHNHHCHCPHTLSPRATQGALPPAADAWKVCVGRSRLWPPPDGVPHGSRLHTHHVAQRPCRDVGVGAARQARHQHPPCGWRVCVRLDLRVSCASRGRVRSHQWVHRSGAPCTWAGSVRGWCCQFAVHRAPQLHLYRACAQYISADAD